MLKLITNFDQFFSEGNGQLSNIRLNSSLCVLCAIALTVIATLKGQAVDLGAVITLLAAGFGPKVFQKSLEGKNGVKPHKEEPSHV